TMHAALRLAPLALGLCSCLSARPPWLGTEYALLAGGSVRLAPGEAPVEALLIEDGRVLAAGTRAELEQRAAELEQRARDWDVELALRRIDLRGGCAVPGLVDAHGHLEGLGEKLENIDLAGCPSYAELVER